MAPSWLVRAPVRAGYVAGDHRKQGTIETFQLCTGIRMLVPAAIEAVRQWRYRPYILNGSRLKWIHRSR